jgi:hypothetical protein
MTTNTPDDKSRRLRRIDLSITPSPKKLTYVFTTEGWVNAPISDLKDASTIGKYHNAVRKHLRGDDSELEQLEGKTFRVRGKTYTVETDIDAIDEEASAGELDFEDIYEYIFM